MCTERVSPPWRRRTATAAISLLLLTQLHAEELPGESGAPLPGTTGDEAAAVEDEASAVTTSDAAGEGKQEDGEPSSYVATMLMLGAGRDTGFLVGEQETDDTLYLARPTVLMEHRPSRRLELTLAYSPEVERFADHTDLSTIHHAAAARFRFDPTTRSTIFAGASYLGGEDPSRGLADLALVLPRGPYDQSQAFVGHEQRWQRSSLVVQIGYTQTVIDPGTGVFSRGVDQSEAVGALHYALTMTEHLSGTASYSYARASSATIGGDLPEDELLESGPLQSATLGLGAHGGHYTFGVSAGVHRSDRSSLLGTAELARNGERLAVVLRYDHGPLSLSSWNVSGDASAGATGGLPASTIESSRAQTLSLGISARLASRLRWEQVVWASHATLPEREELDSLAASSRLVLDVATRFGLYLQADHFQQDGAIPVDDPYSRTRLSLGVVIGLSGPPSAWGIRREPEVLSSLFPGGRVSR